MKQFGRVLLGSSLLALASCATPGFDRAWKQSVSSAPRRGEVTGAWAGTWTSAANGHTGKLRCLVEQKDEDTLSFRYWASWAGWMQATFRAEGDVQPGPDGRYRVKGTKKMFPWGTYSHEGVISPDHMEASFRSERSNLGRFEMSRPSGD
jgi:hypothetical protein